MLNTNRKSLFQVWLAFELLALILRWPSFFHSVLDHDESTYIVIADALRKGNIYFVDVIDNKPIGIFLLFALFQNLFGSSIILIRLIAASWVALTAVSLFWMHRRMRSSDDAAWASGLIYIFMTSIFVHFGLSPNTEIFYVLFTGLAFAWVLPVPGNITAIVSGILLGIGFLIKYVVAFDALALGLFILISYRKQGWLMIFRTGGLMVLGFCIPILILFGYYHQLGKLDALMYYTFELSYKYVSGRGDGSYLIFFGDLLGRYLPISCWFFLAVRTASKSSAHVKQISILWFLACTAAIILQGKFFYHYFIQLMLPLAFGAGSFFDAAQQHHKFWKRILQRKTGGVALVALTVITTGIQVQQVLLKTDYPKQVASWLDTRMQPGETLYTGNYHQIIYHLTEQNSPTPYVHSSLLTNEKHLFAQGISHYSEMEKILKQQPNYILIDKVYPVATSPIHQELNSNYQLVKIFGEHIMVYQRKL
jgi:4-amino-4-deoxy-L-arabinose transferase-like glycosyltransferase